MKKISKRVLAVILTIAMLLPMGTFGVVSNAEANIPGDAVEFNGHYYRVFNENKTWTESKEYCESIGGHLITITSSQEQSFVQGIIANATLNIYWIGLTTENLEPRWITGEVFDYSNWAEGNPDNLVEGEYYVHIYAKDHIKYDTIWQTLGQWNDLTNDAKSEEGSDIDFYNKVGFICEWESKIQPDGYDFETDRWKFENINETIDKRYFIDMFEVQKGEEVFNWMENGSAHGHCFGMAISTAATLWNCPYVTDYISWTSFPYQKLSSVNKGTMNIDLDITAKDYIKYCHVYQGSTAIQSQRYSDSHNGIVNVYNAVKTAINQYSDGSGVVIDLWGTPGGHTVYAIGIDGNDILVNDSNEPGAIKRIQVSGDSWSYSGGGWIWSSSAGSLINYVDDVITPYMRLRWNVPISTSSYGLSRTGSSFSYTEEEELNGTTAHFSDTIEPVDTDKLLVVAERDSFSFAQSGDMCEVMMTDGDSSQSQNQLYWLTIGNTINVENTSGSTSTVKLVGNEVKIVSELPVGASAEVTVDDEGESRADYTVDNASELTVSFVTLDENRDFVTATITGTADGDTVTASETSDGVQVTGLNDITVTLETADGSAETSAKVTDGETVNITVDDPNNTVTTDWQCKHPDDNHDGICDNCGEDFTKDCDCFCHSESKFMQFIYKIVRFLWKLFGIEDRHFCACGKAHW